MQPIIIYGTGGSGREIAWLVQSTYQPVCFINDDPLQQGAMVNQLPVLSLSDAYAQFPQASVLVGIGSPQVREIVTQKAINQGFSIGTFIHPSVIYPPDWVTVGIGTTISTASVLTVNTAIGQHVQINLQCSINHDVFIGDYTTLSPNVHIAGHVQIGKRVFIGMGANIINGTPDQPLVIADDVVIGAGACVTRSITQAGVTAVGVPAKVVNR